MQLLQRGCRQKMMQLQKVGCYIFSHEQVLLPLQDVGIYNDGRGNANDAGEESDADNQEDLE